MKAKIIKIKPFTSKWGGLCYLVCFKGNDGKAYRSYIYTKLRNYKNWKNLLKEGTKLEGLNVIKNNLVDADSPVKRIKK